MTVLVPVKCDELLAGMRLMGAAYAEVKWIQARMPPTSPPVSFDLALSGMLAAMTTLGNMQAGEPYLARVDAAEG